MTRNFIAAQRVHGLHRHIWSWRLLDDVIETHTTRFRTSISTYARGMLPICLLCFVSLYDLIIAHRSKTRCVDLTISRLRTELDLVELQSDWGLRTATDEVFVLDFSFPKLSFSLK